MIHRLALSLLFLLTLTIGASAVGCTGTGNCYYEGTSGNWSNTALWCTTDTNPCTGATGGLPGSGDNCNFTSTSNPTAYTVTVDTAANCKDMTWALPGTSGVPTLASSSGGITVAGNITLVTGMLWTATVTVTLNGTGSQTITSSGVSVGSGFNLNVGAGTYTLTDNLTIGATRTFTVSGGTLVTGAHTHSFGFFVSTSGTRTLTLDNSTINITGTSGTPWNLSAGASTLTLSATGSTINFTGGAANTSLTLSFSQLGNNLNYGAVNITGPGLWLVGGSATFKNFSYTSTTDKRDQMLVQTGGGSITIAASGSLTLAGNSAVNRAFVTSNGLGNSRNISVPNTATVTLTNVDFQDINATGTFGTWTGTSLGDALGNSGITFDASVTLTWDTSKTGAQNWSGSNWLGTTNRVPLPQDDVTLPSIGSATTITWDMPRSGRNNDWSAFNRTMGTGSLTHTIFGNLALGASGTFTAESLLLQGRGAQTLTSNGKAFAGGNVTQQAFGGSYTLQDAASGFNQLSISNGTFDSQGFTVSMASFASSGAVTREIKGTSASTWSVTNTSGTPWSAAATLTVTNFQATIKLTGNVTTNITFAGAGLTYNNLWWSNTAAIGTLIFTGANTFNDVKWNRTTARGLRFPAATITNISSWTDESLGTAVLTIDSSSAGSQATLRKTSGIVSTDYLSLKDNAATGGAAFFAGNHSSIVSNVTGWILAGPGGGGLLTLGFGQ